MYPAQAAGIVIHSLVANEKSFVPLKTVVVPPMSAFGGSGGYR
jgi:hypothetical protein